MTEVKQSPSSLDERNVEPMEESEEESEEEEEKSFWDYFARYPYTPFLFH
jgi:hypothetical protein